MFVAYKVFTMFDLGNSISDFGAAPRKEQRVLYSQAARVLNRFGGPNRLWRMLDKAGYGKSINKSTIYRWLYTKEKGGTGGVIPSRVMDFLIKFARLEGVLLEAKDFFPGFYEIDKPRLKYMKTWLQTYLKDVKDPVDAHRAIYIIDSGLDKGRKGRVL